MNTLTKISIVVLITTAILAWKGGLILQGQAPYTLRMVTSDDAGGGDAAIAPDGKSFVTSLWRNGNWQLWIYEIDARRWRQITNHPSDNFEGQWSPDGKRIVFTSNRTGNKNIFLLTIESGEIRQVTYSSDDDEYPRFSPDGRHVVYTGGKWKQRLFYIANIDDGSSWPVTENPGKAGACSFHPSGSFLVCHSYDSGMGHLLLQSVSGGAPLELTEGNVWDYKPTVSPDGQWLAFSRSLDGPSAIWLMPFPAAQPFPITPLNYDNDDRWPTWSEMGDKLLFHRLVERGLAIKILNRETGAVETIVGREDSPGQASFDPESRHIVYAALEAKKQVLRIKSLEAGSGRTIPLGTEAAFPRWSPNGENIAFTCWNGERWDICTVHPDGTGFKNWTASVHDWRDLRDPIDWSPDSTKLVFHASTQPFEANLYVLDLHDGGIRNLTNDSWFNESPSWVPDGKSIIFMSTRGGNWTWGFFKLSLQNGTYSTFAGPDYTQRNFPRTNRQGDVVWSTYGKDGIEYLAESSVDNALRGADSWARWPSYSTDGQLIIYTQIEHRVEYWIAENLRGPGSPLLRPKISNLTSANSKLNAQWLESTASTTPPGGSSPVEVFHR